MQRRAFLLAAALLAPANAARGLVADDGPAIRGVSTRVSGRDVCVDTRLSPALPEEVLQRLASGLPTTVAWELRLFVFRNLWFDGLKDERRYAVTATYRPVTADYAVERRLDARLLETRVVPTRDEAAAALARVPALPSFTMGDHLIGKKLVVRVRCLYGSGVALGVMPTSAETAWVRSGIFEWTASGAR
ncbi:MAG TPA: DUF4390 domain-containing protein [Thermoanaerobaculia bacterium]|nr:DUF4390 domain-containing protein [Thermoanaerobaculia bacterium]